MLNKSRVALFFGTVVALAHAIWAVLVAAGWAQGFMEWVMARNFLSTTHTVGSFDLANAVGLVALAFFIGLVDGYILATLWNWIVGKKK